MRNSFKLTYIDDDKMIENMSERIKEAVEEGNKNMDMPSTSEISDILFTNETIRIESTCEYIFTEEDKTQLLNIFKKTEYMEEFLAKSTLADYISKIKQSILSDQYNKKTLIDSVYEVFNYFTTKMIIGSYADYMIFSMDMIRGSEDEIENGKEYLIVVEQAMTSSDFKRFLKTTSHWIDNFFYKTICKLVLEDKSFHSRNIQSYNLNYFYAEKCIIKEQNDPILMIDYAVRLVYRKKNAIERLIDDFKKAREESNDNSFNLDISLYNITEKELKIIASLFHHKKRILEEIDIYLYFFQVFLYISNNWENLNISGIYILDSTESEYKTLLKRCRKKREKLNRKGVNQKTIYNNLTKEVEKKTKESILDIEELENRQKTAFNDLMFILFEFIKNENYYKFLLQYKGQIKRMSLLKRNQKIYIRKEIEDNFTRPIYIPVDNRKKKIKIAIIAIIIVLFIILMSILKLNFD